MKEVYDFCQHVHSRNAPFLGMHPCSALEAGGLTTFCIPGAAGGTANKEFMHSLGPSSVPKFRDTGFNRSN